MEETVKIRRVIEKLMRMALKVEDDTLKVSLIQKLLETRELLDDRRDNKDS